MVENRISFPKGVPGRVLFQCGPEGEDPLVDEIENKFRRSGVIISQDGNSGIVVKSVEPAVVKQAVQIIEDWVGALVTLTVEIRGSVPQDMCEKLDYECTHFLNNRPWVCSVALLQDGRCSVTAYGVRSAVDWCIYRVKEIVGEFGVSEIFESEKNISLKIKSDKLDNSPKISSEKSKPYYRWIGNVDVSEKYCISSYILPDYLSSAFRGERSSPEPLGLLPVSILDSLDAFPPENIPVKVEVFQTTCAIPGMKSVPAAVQERLEKVAGPGTRIRVDESGNCTIYSSGSKEQLIKTEAMVRICCSRDASQGQGLDVCESIRMRSIPKSALLRKIESRWRVLLVINKSEILILCAASNKRIGAYIDLYRLETQEGDLPTEVEINSDLGAVLSKTSGGRVLCLRSAIASNAVVELEGETLYVAGDLPRRLIATELLHYLVDGRSERICDYPSLPYLIIPVPALFITEYFETPARRGSANRIAQIESDWGVAIVPADSASRNVLLDPHDSDAGIRYLIIISASSLGRAGAAFQLISVASDFSSDRRRINSAGFYDYSSINESIDDELFFRHIVESKIEEGLRAAFVGRSLGVVYHQVSPTISLLACESAGRLTLAVDILTAPERWASSRYSANVTRDIPTCLSLTKLKEFESRLGCVFVNTPSGIVDVVSVSALRREIAKFVLTCTDPEAELERVHYGWKSKSKLTKSQKSKQRSGRRRDVLSDSDEGEF